MIDDLRQLEDGLRLEADLCIVGSGPAGTAIALRCARSGRSAIVLESGGFAPEPEIQDLNGGEVRGESYFDLRLPRVRALGGTSWHWSGAMAELTAADFDPRPWVAMPGWPIERAEIAAHYPEALELCGGGPWPRDPARDVEAFTTNPMPPGGESWLEVRYRQKRSNGIRRFGRQFRAELKASTSVRVLLHATVTELVSAPGGEHVHAAQVRTLEGKRATVAARAFVLACGGLENPRLLLLSNRAFPDGLGNRHGQVGRCFQEHPELVLGNYVGFDDRLGSLSNVGGALALIRDLCPAVEFARRERSLQFGVALDPRDRRRWQRDQGRPDGQRPFDAEIARLLPWVTDRFEPGTAGEGPRVPETSRGELGTMQEMEPDPDNRVTLGDERDALGCRRLVLHLRFGESFRRTLAASARAVVRELGRFSIGRFAPAPALEAALAGSGFEWRGASHHIGTTRMADDPSQGVVDRDCRVHGVDNLWIAGSSVFPWGGYVNPTLTLVALALRLATHLDRKLG